MRNNTLKRVQILLLLIICFSCRLSLDAKAQDTLMRKISAMEIAHEMAPGINLFNTLDATATWISGLAIETAWGQPYTTFEMVESMADRGFKTLRIPVSWHNHMGTAPENKIDNTWMDRVETVANYALDNGMYAIINIHHDDDFMVPTYEKKDTSIYWVTTIWEQIAERFKDYGDHLLFETMNEPREKGAPEEWSGGNAEHREVINAMNVAIVNTIRNSGGKNDKRFIMVPQVGANIASALEDMIIPNNDTNAIVSVHAYSPYNFCLNESGTDKWGTASEITALQNMMKSLNEKFVSKGQAVVMGEWGAIDKDNYGERVNYYDIYTNACKDNGITPVIWMYNFNRKELVWNSPLLEEAILQAYDSMAVRVENVELNKTADTLYIGETMQLSIGITPENATNKNVAYSSKNKLVASVDQSGLITALGAGTTKITATAIGASAFCNILVLDTILNTEFHIEAEKFSEQSGIQSETCSDENGGENIGYIQNGDWCSYTVNIDTAGIYLFTARTATDTQGGTIEIWTNNSLKGEATVDACNSNGWQDWFTTDPTEIKLVKGLYTIKLTYKGAGGYLFNLNWFELNLKQQSGTSVSDIAYSEVTVYPNPASKYINLILNEKSSLVELYTVNGKLMLSTKSSDSVYKLDVSEMESGMYLLKITNKGISVSKKIIIK